MNIGIICWPSWGGSGIIATELAIALTQKAHNVHLFSWNLPVRLNTIYPNLIFHQIPLETHPLFPHPFYTISLASFVHRIVEEYHLDIIHAHYVIPHTISTLIVKSIAQIKLITTLHGTDIYLLCNSYKSLIEYGLNMSDGITAVSNHLINFTKQNFNIKKDINLIYNFVDTERFKRTKEKKLRKFYAKKGEKILIHISNFRMIKRTPQIIEIFKHVLDKLAAKLILIGEGPELDYVKNKAKQLGVDKDVYFLGAIEETADILSIADLFLLVSEIESFGLAALEAMSCEVPVVAYQVGGIPELIINAETGFLIPSQDIQAFTAAVIKLLTDKELYIKFAKASRMIATQKFNKDYIVAMYEKYYESIL